MYQLFFSVDLGETYQSIKTAQELGDFNSLCKSFDEKMQRWVLLMDGKVVKRSFILEEGYQDAVRQSGSSAKVFMVTEDVYMKELIDAGGGTSMSFLEFLEFSKQENAGFS